MVSDMGEANRRGNFEERMIEGKQRRDREKEERRKQTQALIAKQADEKQREAAYKKMVKETVDQVFIETAVMDAFKAPSTDGKKDSKIILPR